MMEQDETLSALSDILTQVPSQNAIQEFGIAVDLRDSHVAGEHITFVSAGVFEAFTTIIKQEPMIRNISRLRSVVLRADFSIAQYLDECDSDAQMVHGIPTFNEMVLWARRDDDGWTLMFPSEHL